MSGVVNVRRDVSDRFYRYKMPKVCGMIAGMTLLPGLV